MVGTVADTLLAELSPLIEGLWNRAEKLRFEDAFKRAVNRELQTASNEAAEKARSDVMNQIAAFEGWKVLIDKSLLFATKEPCTPLVFEIGRVLSEIRKRAESVNPRGKG